MLIRFLKVCWASPTPNAAVKPRKPCCTPSNKNWRCDSEMRCLPGIKQICDAKAHRPRGLEQAKSTVDIHSEFVLGQPTANAKPQLIQDIIYDHTSHHQPSTTLLKLNRQDTEVASA